MRAKLIAKVVVDPMRCTAHVQAIQVICVPHEPITMWLSRNKGKGTPYLLWLREPTLINKRYWCVDNAVSPVMWVQVEDWPKEFPRLRPGQKLRVGFSHFRFFHQQVIDTETTQAAGRLRFRDE